MAKQKDQKPLILAEWRAWRIGNRLGHSSDPAMFYYWLTMHRPQLLEFRCFESNKHDLIRRWVHAHDGVREGPDDDDGNVDPAAARVFARQFPGIELKRLYASETKRTVLACEGEARRLIELGVVGPAMLAPPPKRKSQGSWWWTERIARGRARVKLNFNDEVGAEHPLAAFAPRNWPIRENIAERRELFEQALRNAADSALSMVTFLDDAFTRVQSPEFRLVPAQYDEIKRLFDQFHADLREATRRLRVERRPGGPTLRAVGGGRDG